MNERAATFKAVTGIEVQINSFMDRGAVLVWAAGGALPDVFDVVTDQWFNYVRGGVFQDLRPFLSKGDVRSTHFIPLTLQGFTVSADYSQTPGAIMAVPFSFWSVLPGVNLDMIEGAGLTSPNDLGSSWDWQALERFTSKLSRDVDGDGTPDEYGLFLRAHINRWAMIFRHGGIPIYNRDMDPDKVQLNTPEALATLEYLTALVRNGNATTSANFSHGNIAITWDAGPNFGYLLRPETGVLFDVDHVPYPYGPTGASGTEFTMMGSSISSTCKQPDIAWKWLSFLWGSPEGSAAFCKATNRPPALRSQVGYYSGAVNTWVEHSRLVADMLDYAGSGLRPVVRDPQVQNVIQSAVNDALGGKIAPRAALAQAQEQATALLRAAFAR